MEGVIKYKCNWQKEESLPEADIEDLIEIRRELFKAGLIGEDELGTGFGNISKRIGNTSKFIISGTQTGSLTNICAQHFTTVTSYSIENNELFCIGPVKASSESLTHAALYQISENTNAIIHIHSIGNWQKFLNILPTSKQTIDYGTVEMASEIQRLWQETELPQKKILIMGGHEGGIITFGKNIKEAMKILRNYIRF